MISLGSGLSGYERVLKLARQRKAGRIMDIGRWKEMDALSRVEVVTAALSEVVRAQDAVLGAIEDCQREVEHLSDEVREVAEERDKVRDERDEAEFKLAGDE